MPGEVSRSYEGPSDKKPTIPEWAYQTPMQASEQSPGPLSHEEAKQFYEGFLCGATAYAVAIGHSGLESENSKLREVLDAQGWKTIEDFARTPPMPPELERYIADWLRANDKRPEQVVHGTFPLGVVQRWIERAQAAEAFKAWVHAWLDSHGVPADPNPEHTTETGCRISGRMEWVWRQLAEARDNANT